MKSYIFMCNWETYGECITRNLFGMAKNFAADIKPGDLCYLFQYDLKKFFGVWEATSECGWHEKDAWDGKFKYQVKVQLLSKEPLPLPFANVEHIVEHSGVLIYKLDDVRSSKLLDTFKDSFKNADDLEQM